MLTVEERKLAFVVHQGDLLKFMGTTPNSPQSAKWVPCRTHFSGSVCNGDTCPFAHSTEDVYNSWSARRECEKGPVNPELLYYQGTRFIRKRKQCLDAHEAQRDPGDSDEEAIPDCETFWEENREPKRNIHYDTEVLKPVQQQTVIQHSENNWLCNPPSLDANGLITKVSTPGEGAASNHDSSYSGGNTDTGANRGRFCVYEVCGSVFVKRKCSVWLPSDGGTFMDLTTDDAGLPSYSLSPDHRDESEEPIKEAPPRIWEQKSRGLHDHLIWLSRNMDHPPDGWNIEDAAHAAPRLQNPSYCMPRISGSKTLTLLKRDGRLHDVTIPYGPHGLYWHAVKIRDEMYLKIITVASCSWSMVVGILPQHFIVAIDGVKVARLGSTHKDWSRAMKMVDSPPRPGDFTKQIPVVAQADPNTIVVDADRYVGNIQGWTNMVKQLGNQPRYAQLQTTHEQIERTKMHEGWQRGDYTDEEIWEARAIINRNVFPDIATPPHVARSCWDIVASGASYTVPKPENATAEKLKAKARIFFCAMEIALKEERVFEKNWSFLMDKIKISSKKNNWIGLHFMIWMKHDKVKWEKSYVSSCGDVISDEWVRMNCDTYRHAGTQGIEQAAFVEWAALHDLFPADVREVWERSFDWHAKSDFEEMMYVIWGCGFIDAWVEMKTLWSVLEFGDSQPRRCMARRYDGGLACDKEVDASGLNGQFCCDAHRNMDGSLIFHRRHEPIEATYVQIPEYLQHDAGLVQDALDNTKDPSGYKLPPELISNEKSDQLLLVSENPIVPKTYLPKGKIAAICGQFATVCRVDDTVQLNPKGTLFAKIGSSPHRNDGRRWVTYFYPKDKNGVHWTKKRPLSGRCDYVAGARGNEADDKSNEGCECLIWYPDENKDSSPIEDKGCFALWCAACERNHSEKEVHQAGNASLHHDFRPSQHDWKSVQEFSSDLKWLQTRIKNVRNSDGAYPVWKLAIQSSYIQRIAASLNYFIVDPNQLKALVNPRCWARSLQDGMGDSMLAACCGALIRSNNDLATHLKTQKHKDWVTRMRTCPRLLSEFKVVPDGHCIHALDKTYYYSTAQLEDAANAQCAHMGLPLIGEDRFGIYMSIQPIQLDYERTKDMLLEEKPSKLNDTHWKIPKAITEILPRDFGGGSEVEDSDGEEIVDSGTLVPYALLPLVPNDDVTELQAKINRATRQCLHRRLTRCVRGWYHSFYQWGGHWDKDGVFVPSNTPMEWMEPEYDEDNVKLPEYHCSSHRKQHFLTNMPTPPMTKLPSLDTMDRVRFHAHFTDASGPDGIKEKKRGEADLGCSVFIPRYAKVEGHIQERVNVRENAIQVPTVPNDSRQAKSVDMDANIDDLEWCLRNIKDWNAPMPYATYCKPCNTLAMKRLTSVDLFSHKHRRDNIGHRYSTCFKCERVTTV